ncbi:MAG: ABC transporter ATP-binding protein [Sphingomonadales bacterium]|nr:ABC transporter ATP-binding protein [Sphingomonadales bacterium]
MEPILEIQGLCKTYAGGVVALKPTELTINKGEIFALLGPNGAGKTTLIGLVCGLVRWSGGSARAFGLDLKQHWREARKRIGLVPQELQVDMFEYVLPAISHSRALFGREADPAKIETLLRSLSLWDKRDKRISELSGGMKRRVLIAKALAHEPDLLFLDEPTAGVDVELRRDMWALIAQLREQGVTVILTTHYIEEAEEMADRIGVIDHGELKLVEEKTALMARLGRTEARFTLAEPLQAIPPALDGYKLALADDGKTLCYRADGEQEHNEGVAGLVKALVREGVDFTGLSVSESSLEDIFVDLVGRNRLEADR